MTLWKRTNYRDSETISGVRSWGRGNKQGTEDSESSEKTVWICHVGYMSLDLWKPIECTTPRVDPSVHYGLWVTRMCQCRFSNYNKCPTLVEMLITREAGLVWGQGIYEKCGKFLFLPFNFAGNLNCCNKSLSEKSFQSYL